MPEKTDEKNIERAYADLARKYSLPSFEELDAEFELSLIEHEARLMANIRKHVADKVSELSEMIENIVQPDSDVAGIYESRTFSDSEKSKIFDIFKELRMLLRASHQAMLRNTEKNDAEFVKRVWADWKKLKEKLLPIIEKLENSWKEPTAKEEKLGYFG